MDHLATRLRPDSLARSRLPTEDRQVKVKEEGRSRDESNKSRISEQESRIRAELELDIVRDLEGEIKGEIYRLALRLHNLYQHQHHHHKQKKHIYQTSNHICTGATEKEAISGMNIRINMDGGTKVEIKETKKKQPRRVYPLHADKNRVAILKHGTKKFDWTQSLRSDPPKPSIRNKIGTGTRGPRFSGPLQGPVLDACERTMLNLT